MSASGDVAKWNQWLCSMHMYSNGRTVNSLPHTNMSASGDVAKLGTTDSTKFSVPGWDQTYNALVSTLAHHASQVHKNRNESYSIIGFSSYLKCC